MVFVGCWPSIRRAIQRPIVSHSLKIHQIGVNCAKEEHVLFDTIASLFQISSSRALCGLLGALFVWLHRRYMRIIKYNPIVKKFLGMNRFIYPGLGAFIIASITFPLGFGRFIASEVTTHHQLTDLFNNITWSKANLSVSEVDALHSWVPEGTNVFGNLFSYFGFHVRTRDRNSISNVLQLIPPHSSSSSLWSPTRSQCLVELSCPR